MNTFKHFWFFMLALLAIPILWSGCDEDEEVSFIKINLNHHIGNTKAELNNTWYSCAAGHKFNVIRLKYYISRIKLHNSNGKVFESETVHYCDIEKPSTRVITFTEIPNGEYTRLSFVFGLDDKMNVNGGLPNTTTNINMEWPIPGDRGYHYMKLEGKYNVFGNGTIKAYNIHTGATRGNQNFLEFDLPLKQPIQLNKNQWEINLVMDINEWLQNPLIYNFEDFGADIMENQDAQIIIKKNGADLFSINSIVKN